MHNNAILAETTVRGRVPRSWTARLAMATGLATITALTTLVVATDGPASASTLNGEATIASPGVTTPLTSGGSQTQFTVALPAQAACDGDTATHGYHVYSYLVKKGTTLSTVTFLSHPSVGYGLFDATGKYFGPANTAVTTGQIVGIPNNLEWAPLVTDHGVALSSLLYTGTGSAASGIWEAGIACATSGGALADNWNTQVTFNASASDPNKFTWTTLAITTASLGTATRGKAYSLQLTESGGIAPLTWTNTTPALPKGLKLSAAGKITGTVPSTVKAATYKVGFSLKDSTKPTALTTTKTLSIVVK